MFCSSLFVLLSVFICMARHDIAESGIKHQKINQSINQFICMATVLYVVWFTDSDYPFSIFKLFLYLMLDCIFYSCNNVYESYSVIQILSKLLEKEFLQLNNLITTRISIADIQGSNNDVQSQTYFVSEVIWIQKNEMISYLIHRLVQLNLY